MQIHHLVNRLLKGHIYISSALNVFFTTMAFTVYTIKSVKRNNNTKYIFVADMTVVSFLLRTHAVCIHNMPNPYLYWSNAVVAIQNVDKNNSVLYDCSVIDSVVLSILLRGIALVLLILTKHWVRVNFHGKSKLSGAIKLKV